MPRSRLFLLGFLLMLHPTAYPIDRILVLKTSPAVCGCELYLLQPWAFRHNRQARHVSKGRTALPADIVGRIRWHTLASYSLRSPLFDRFCWKTIEAGTDAQGREMQVLCTGWRNKQHAVPNHQPSTLSMAQAPCSCT